MTADLRFARLTARGEAGLSVFRLRGRAVAGVLARIFRARGAARLGAGQVRVGTLLDGDAALDDVVVRIRATPDGWEADLSTHGSPYVGDRLAAMFAEAGGRPLGEEEREGSLRRAGIGAGDAVVAEAREALLAAFADRQALFFLHALDGGLSRAVRSLARSLGTMRRGHPLEPVDERIEALTTRAPFGLAMASPPVVLLAGAPNSGKSSLFNALLGEDRAIVSAAPGTTRDVVADSVSFDGFPFRLLDSAGLRETGDDVERLGVDRARCALDSADIVVVLLDPGGDVEAQTRIAADVQPRARRIVVFSKCDQPGSAAWRASLRGEAWDAVPTSSRTGEGIDGLRSRIVRASAFGGSASLLQPAPFLARHVETLDACRRALASGAPPARAAEVLESLVSGNEGRVP